MSLHRRLNLPAWNSFYNRLQKFVEIMLVPKINTKFPYPKTNHNTAVSHSFSIPRQTVLGSVVIRPSVLLRKTAYAYFKKYQCMHTSFSCRSLGRIAVKAPEVLSFSCLPAPTVPWTPLVPSVNCIRQIDVFIPRLTTFVPAKVIATLDYAWHQLRLPICVPSSVLPLCPPRSHHNERELHTQPGKHLVLSIWDIAYLPRPYSSVWLADVKTRRAPSRVGI